VISLKKIALVQIIVVGIGASLIFVLERPFVPPFLWGAALVSLNFVLLGQMWRGILEKKSVAMTIGLVVIKYAILVIVLYVFVKEWKLPLLPLFEGLATMALSFLIATVWVK